MTTYDLERNRLALETAQFLSTVFDPVEVTYAMEQLAYGDALGFAMGKAMSLSRTYNTILPEIKEEVEPSPMSEGKYLELRAHVEKYTCLDRAYINHVYDVGNENMSFIEFVQESIDENK